ncbi:MAG: glycosyltransferase family 61 protein [Cyanobium sp. M30B3]|nr:MAG: glycosyltransferase family 61 protein [Cyanobium sp. M30B3]
MHALKGTVISLCSDHSINNYGHFLLDCLTRIRLLQAASISLADADHIIMPKPPSQNAISLCEKAGIPLAKCIWSDKNALFHADHLMATTFPGLRRSCPQWAASFLNGLNDSSCERPFRKIYIPRESRTRNIVNDASLRKIALHYGYQIYNPAIVSDTTSYEIFAQATHIVSAHGAALTDLAFCPTGAKVLELIPSDHIYPYYYTLSLASGLAYHCIFGESANMRPRGSVGPSPYDFVVDCDLFSEALGYLG